MAVVSLATHNSIVCTGQPNAPSNSLVPQLVKVQLTE
jgi:hypothetical protein